MATFMAAVWYLQVYRLTQKEGYKEPPADSCLQVRKIA